MFHLRPFIAAIAAAGSLFLGTACLTPSSRINDSGPAFQKLPAPEQPLVRAGKIRVGFDKDTVYLAWGKADYIKQDAAQGQPAEVWTYIGYRQDTVQHFDVIPRPLPGRRGFAGEPITTPVYENHPYIRAQVRFQNGKVVAWSDGRLP